MSRSRSSTQCCPSSLKESVRDPLGVRMRIVAVAVGLGGPRATIFQAQGCGTGRQLLRRRRAARAGEDTRSDRYEYPWNAPAERGSAAPVDFSSRPRRRAHSTKSWRFAASMESHWPRLRCGASRRPVRGQDDGGRITMANPCLASAATRQSTGACCTRTIVLVCVRYRLRTHGTIPPRRESPVCFW